LAGYVNDKNGDNSVRVASRKNEDLAREMGVSLDDVGGDSTMIKPLFHKFPSVQSVAREDFRQVSKKGAELAQLSGAIYQDVIPNVHKLGHAIVANGTAADVLWMVTDGIAYKSDFEKSGSMSKAKGDDPVLIRYITIRGFDATDENVDRERLLNKICSSEPVPLSDQFEGLMVHKGLLEVAQALYKDIIPYIDLTAPTHKIVLTGHSIGGALSNLLLFLLAIDRGNIFVQDKVQRVFTFGSPPIAIVNDGETELESHGNGEDSISYDCPILEAIGLPSDMVYGYVQPWDPIIRFFSRIDPLYPLIGDLGADGFTLYASGPPRTLRPITRAILVAWEKWPTFRDDYRGVMDQNFRSTGVQHLLMPDQGRYLTDRLLSVNVNAFPVDEVLRVSSAELYEALEEAFPLDVFSISLVPTAIRSFIHHFFPAYSEGFEAYMAKEDKKDVDRDDGSEIEGGTEQKNIVDREIEAVTSIQTKKSATIEFADQAARWVSGGGGK